MRQGSCATRLSDVRQRRLRRFQSKPLGRFAIRGLRYASDPPVPFPCRSHLITSQRTVIQAICCRLSCCNYVCTGIRVLPEEPFFCLIYGRLRFSLLCKIVQNSRRFSVRWAFAKFEDRVCTRVDGLAHTLRNLIHVDFCGRFDVLVTQDGLRVFHRSMLLQFSS